MINPPVRPIYTRAELIALAAELGVRPDWHEPDEQDVTARVEGTPLNFDNAMGPGHWYGAWKPGDEPQAELHVILCRKEIEGGVAKRGPDIATVNLASLFAWATEPEQGSEVVALRRRVRELENKLHKVANFLGEYGNARGNQEVQGR
jgi:hypothetical protein